MEDDGFVVVSRESTQDSCPDHVPRQVEESSGSNNNFVSEIGIYIESLGETLWKLNQYLHENPELAFKEYKAHQALTDFLRSREEKWHITPSACGLETAWIAVHDSGRNGPVVSFNVEMAGLATAELMKRHNMPGKVVLFGTPGEEGLGGGKIQLLKRGAYRGVDISLISHPGILNNSPLVRTTAFARLEVEYFGRAAHGAKNPWMGINALDALVVSYNAVSALRQQTKPGDVIGVAITNGGEQATNVIHAYAACVCMIHATTSSRLAELQEKVSSCFRAGAVATGANVNITVTSGYQDHVPNRVLAASYRRYWSMLPDPPDPPLPADGQFTWVRSSTDQGDLSHALPSVNASFAIPPGPEAGQPHSPDFEKASGTRSAFARALRVGKALAGTAIDVLTIPGLLDEVKRQWRRDMKATREQFEEFSEYSDY
ncbi:hypothetical protein MYCTH_51839 [Thermothelomyces thermophilus ATCC 42464]|uniref:Peptidase M20 domain-containing protein 2 n=1 Tax=Thermothelomyces thermophilus (strain ATCC 42464 / BCRC 31852 / DSM 1799) TaxID=573729 RepID=G2QGW4_THET4|nr:uncharacterized protein MYCTH_51839 [Thermothelomyces thermophilus ATCC 42464]AEO59471.1 hypothetical protein MYCTH_51839 [Thermothelomyces thermophilus ATCC 42464]